MRRMAKSRPRHRRLPYLLRVIRGRPRLFVSAAVGAVVATVLTDRLLATRLILGWDLGVILYLALSAEVMARSHVGAIRHHAALQDEGQLVILVLTAGAALASFGAIIAELGSAKAAGARHAQQVGLAIATILLSWIFTHTIFALHYAHEFYGEHAKHGGGLTFPGGEEPDYWDFVYFSFVIGMTSQVSDVAISSKVIRRTATAHGVLAFIFNAAILALTINIVASAL
jgi:uncharacterized membrane protein